MKRLLRDFEPIDYALALAILASLGGLVYVTVAK